LLIVVAIVVLYILSSIKILSEYERAVVFRLGRLVHAPKGPGITLTMRPPSWPRPRCARSWGKWSWTTC